MEIDSNHSTACMVVLFNSIIHMFDKLFLATKHEVNRKRLNAIIDHIYIWNGEESTTVRNFALHLFYICFI